MQREGAYAAIQSTKPQSLAHALNDSPAGLAGWIVEKFRSWSDCDGDIESRFTRDELLTQIMIYWATESIGSSFLPYHDYANANPLDWVKEGMKNGPALPTCRRLSHSFLRISVSRRANGLSDSSMCNVGPRWLAAGISLLWKSRNC